MIIRSLYSESELEEYKKIYDIAIATNYGDSYLPKKNIKRRQKVKFSIIAITSLVKLAEPSKLLDTV